MEISQSSTDIQNNSARLLKRGSSSSTVRQSSSTPDTTYGDADYGIAYQNTYSGGFYYGDLSNEDGSLPTCF